MLGSNGTEKDTLQGPRFVAAVKRSIQILQKSSELQAGSVAQEAAKACCLDSLSSDRGYRQNTFVFRATICSGSQHTKVTCAQIVQKSSPESGPFLAP